MNLTREQMLNAGMTEDQINAVFDTLGGQQKQDYNMPAIVSIQRRDTAKSNTGGEVPINCEDSMKVTSIFDLQSYSRGTLVRFPDFAEGQPFVARVRRPSMLVLAKQGKIPNTLLASANELFSKGGAGVDVDNQNMLADMYDIMEVICDAALQEPTYQQIKDAGLTLSDNQIMAIFNYTQTGIKALESFR